AGKYERLLTVIWNPARRKRSTVAVSRLPLGIPSFSFISVAVNRGGIVSSLVGDFPFVVFEPAEEAALVAFVTNARPEGFHFQEHCISIAVGQDFFHDKFVPRGLAFQPELVPRAAIKNGVSRFDRLAKRFFVHEADHEDAAGFPILDNGGDQSVEFT